MKPVAKLLRDVPVDGDYPQLLPSASVNVSPTCQLWIRLM